MNDQWQEQIVFNEIDFIGLLGINIGEIMEIAENMDNNICILSLNGKLDAYYSIELENSIKKVIQGGCSSILVNFQGVEYISSSGLRVILSSLKQLKKLGGQLKLSNLKPYVKEVFEISGFTQIFEIYENEKEALESFKA